MRVPTLTGVAVLIQLCLAELQEPLGDKSSENDTPLNEAFNKRVEWALEHYNIPGLAVGVVRDGQEFAKGYGFANITSGAPVTADTLFFAGSTTKAHTAAAISLLVDDNTKYPHIQWDTPVYSLIPEVFSLSDPYYTTHITITDMLSHRSGLPRHDTILLQNLTTKEILLRMKHLPLTAEIRTESQYCNLMYITAAYLVESVTGHSLDSFLHENIWSVLGMTSTTLDLSAAKAAGSHVAEGYYTSLETNKSIPTNQAYTPAVTGAGNILTSAADYNKWISTLLAQNLPISKSGYNALFSPHSLADPVNGPPVTPPFGSPNLYGFGWFLQTYKGERIIQHGGAQVGFGAFVLLLPDRGFGLSILGNDMLGTNDATQILAFELIDTFLGLKEEDRFDWAGVYVLPIHLFFSFVHVNYFFFSGFPSNLPNNLTIS
ncbi:beta-lactamase/transpeptidase-like protein [Aspergillus karnatakaensis]|uniref:serine hydrolase domain-containing protein n=1 Tax=Aspergillus karnatakaensis TaxID=1810916 RepID=UPI003CCCF4F7